MRLDKYLSNMGVGTRSEVKKTIAYGKVQVNGLTTKKINHSVNPDTDEVTAYGQVIGFEEHVYIMLNKPAGYLSATEDKVDKTVMDLINHPRKKQLFPVGRLDKDTVGLLLLTDDGKLSHLLRSPKKHVPKTYYAKIDGVVTLAHGRAFREGIEFDEFTSKPADLKIIGAGQESEVELTILEGKYHQVKRMFEAVGTKVTYLKRLSMGSLRLDPSLKEGKWRVLTEEEVQSLKNYKDES